MLRDRLVCGIRDTRVQRRLLAEFEHDFKKAFKLAQSTEVFSAQSTEQGAKDMQNPHQPLHSITKFPPIMPLSEYSCYRCGGIHTADKCYFKNAECHNCHKRGHLTKVCRKEKQQRGVKPRSWPQDRPGKQPRRTHQVNEDIEDPSEPEQPYTMFTQQKRNCRIAPITTTVLVIGASLVMEVDIQKLLDNRASSSVASNNKSSLYLY